MTTFRPLRFLKEGSPEIPTKIAEFGAEAGDTLQFDIPINHGQTQKLAQSGALVADFNDGPVQYWELNGHVTAWTTANRAADTTESRSATIAINPGSSTRNLVFDAAWIFQGQKPAQIAANKQGMLSLLCIGTGEGDVMAWWSVQE